MTAINSVALSNSFDFQRQRLNEVITFVNTEAANNAAVTSTYVTNTAFQSALANTNAYIATKLNTTTFNSALANTNAYIATKLNTTTFNSALANTNIAIADRLQVANASSEYVSKTSTSEQNIQPSVVVANTFVAEHGSPVATKTANNITLTLSDNGKILRCTNTSTTVSVNIPTNASVAFPTGAEVAILNDTANTVVIANNAGVTLRSKDNSTLIVDRYTSASLKKLDTNEWLLIGAISS